jgi:CheY-like chemotaxis protein
MISTRKILVVDDLISYTDILKLNLEEVGKYEVQVEHEGEKALETAAWFQPHVILMDFKVAKMADGSIARALQEDGRTKHIPVLFLSGHTVEGASQPGLADSGAKATMIEKTAKLDALLNTIRSLLSDPGFESAPTPVS